MNAWAEEQIGASVERITDRNQENGYTVLRLKPDERGMLPFKYASGRDALITVVGNMPGPNPGEWVKLAGRRPGRIPDAGRRYLAAAPA